MCTPSVKAGCAKAFPSQIVPGLLYLGAASGLLATRGFRVQLKTSGKEEVSIERFQLALYFRNVTRFRVGVSHTLFFPPRRSAQGSGPAAAHLNGLKRSACAGWCPSTTTPSRCSCRPVSRYGAAPCSLLLAPHSFPCVDRHHAPRWCSPRQALRFTCADVETDDISAYLAPTYDWVEAAAAKGEGALF